MKTSVYSYENLNEERIDCLILLGPSHFQAITYNWLTSAEIFLNTCFPDLSSTS